MNITPEISFPKLGIQIDSLSKVAFTIFGLPFYWYGIFVALGFAVGIYIACRMADKYSLGSGIVADFSFYLIIFSMIGARAYYVIFSWDSYKHDLLKIFAFREGGLAIYGGIIASVIAGVVFCRIKKVNFGLLADCCAPGLAVGQAIGRWGNFVNREAFGTYTNTRFAMRYMTKDVNYVPQKVLEHVLNIGGAEYIQVHPTFLYESFWNLCLCLLLLHFLRRRKFDGEVFALYALGYGIGRMWIEALRTDQLILFGTGIPVSQLLSLLLAIGSVCYIIYRRRRIKAAE